MGYDPATRFLSGFERTLMRVYFDRRGDDSRLAVLTALKVLPMTAGFPLTETDDFLAWVDGMIDLHDGYC